MNDFMLYTKIGNLVIFRIKPNLYERYANKLILSICHMLNNKTAGSCFLALHFCTSSEVQCQTALEIPFTAVRNKVKN